MEQLNETLVRTFKISRSFDAPADRIWQAWTDPAKFEQWWGPVGMPATLVDPDLREGGRVLYRLDGKMGTMWGLFRYTKIDRPNVIEYISSFSNEQGEITKAPFAMDFPLEVFNRIMLSEENGKTVLTLESHPINATTAQEAVHAQMHESMKQGFGGTLDQLQNFIQRKHQA